MSTATENQPQADPTGGLREPVPEDVVCVSGRLDGSSVPEVREQIRRTVAAGHGDVVVDLRLVQWIDATGLAVLVAAHRRLHRQGRRLVLRGCSPGVRRALAVTRLNRVLITEPGLGAL